jgi:hypothetical protein
VFIAYVFVQPPLPCAYPAGHELQVPLSGSQVPAARHCCGWQAIGLAPTHMPDWHWSLWVHALPSLQLVPFMRAGCPQAPAPLHLSSVQSLPSSVHGTVLATGG